MSNRRMIALAMVACVCVGAARAQDAAPPQPAPPAAETFRVTDMFLMLSDEFDGTFNGENLFPNSLPSFAISSTRPRAPIADRTQPMPIGVMRFDGRVPEELDVLINIEDGKPFYGWPPQRMKKDSRLLWQRLVVNQEADALTDTRIEDHWINLLRADGLPVIHANRKAEQALIYDIALNAQNPLKVPRQDNGYGVQRGEQIPILDVTLLKPLEEGKVRRVFLPAAPPAGQPAKTPADQTHATLGEAVGAMRGDLVALGLYPQQVGIAAAVIEHIVAAEDGELVAVYHIDPSWIDQRLPLEITPAPDTVTRVPLVILINADPDLLGTIDALIADLGHPDWSKREHAQSKLAELGEIARARLVKNRNHRDAEVSFRIESLLEQLDADKSIDKP